MDFFKYYGAQIFTLNKIHLINAIIIMHIRPSSHAKGTKSTLFHMRMRMKRSGLGTLGLRRWLEVCIGISGGLSEPLLCKYS